MSARNRGSQSSGKSGAFRGKVKPFGKNRGELFAAGARYSGSEPFGGIPMEARGAMRNPWAPITLVIFLLATGWASAWEQYRYPIKVRVSGANPSDATVESTAKQSARWAGDWEVAAGQPRRQILCPRKDYAFALGMRPYFASVTGSTKVVSRGGEGTFLNLYGHLRMPTDVTLWEFYAYLKAWDKINLRLEYTPWAWGGPGHVSGEGNFAGLLLKKDDAVQSELNITSFVIGADYDVLFGRDLIFGPNADLHLIKWVERVSKDGAAGVDFSQTLIQPAIGAHVRYQPTNTGYFSWFKPYLEGRFSWMSFAGLGLSTWDAGVGIAPPLSRNVDAGIKAGYKQWRLDGNRGRLFADVSVEGLYLDFSLQF